MGIKVIPSRMVSVIPLQQRAAQVLGVAQLWAAQSQEGLQQDGSGSSHGKGATHTAGKSCFESLVCPPWQQSRQCSLMIPKLAHSLLWILELWKRVHVLCGWFGETEAEGSRSCQAGSAAAHVCCWKKQTPFHIFQKCGFFCLQFSRQMPQPPG